MAPTLSFQTLMFSLIGCGLLNGSEHSDVKRLLLKLFLVSYDALTALLNFVFIVETIRTWKRVRDNIHVRGELILQTFILLMSYIVLLVIYLFDTMLPEDSAAAQSEELFNFGYFLNNSMTCLCSIIIGTHYLHWKRWKAERSHSQNMDEHFMRLIVAGEVQIDRTTIDFREVIQMSDGLEAFMKYLVTENEQNYLIVKALLSLSSSNSEICICCLHQLAMELTQYRTKLCCNDDMVGPHEDLLDFPLSVPKSSLIQHSSSMHTAFMQIFDKYLSVRATWKVRLDDETRERILKPYRRLDELKKHIVVRSECPRDPPDDVPSLQDVTSEIRGNLDRRNANKEAMHAANITMKKVITELERSFDVYRNTAVNYTNVLIFNFTNSLDHNIHRNSTNGFPIWVTAIKKR